MCGISGIVNRNGEILDEVTIQSISDTLKHRGPDNGSIKITGNIALGHRRLSVIDLSEEANQPMSSQDGRFLIVFNGEIYNFLEIKQNLQDEGFRFKTNSDTEVVLASYEKWGGKAFDMFNGMFAIAIYDFELGLLILARDHFGIKPLYYYIDDNVLIFASEMKAILKYPNIELTLNYQALVEYFWFENALGDKTFYKEIHEVSPGSSLRFSNNKLSSSQYFNINTIKEINISEQEAIIKIRELFEDSVKRHLISDVPIGIFLSGGIDSSSITAFASKHYKGKLKTYSVAFDYDKENSELNLAKEVATKFGTEHHEVEVSGTDLISTIEALVYAHDEPFGDSANIPLYLLTQKLKGEVKVVLQGDGGDEFFGGYSRYKSITNLSKWSKLRFLLPLISLSKTKNLKVLRFQRFINAISQNENYLRNGLLLTMESQYTNPLRVLNDGLNKEVKGLDPFNVFQEIYKELPSGIDKSQALFYTDVQTILKDTYFEKVDKSTMANSMEIRVPFIDKDLALFALSLPSTIKTKNGEQKYLLKKAMEGFVPHNILYGKKKGFGVPYSFWLKNSLVDYFKQQVSSPRAQKYLNEEEVLKLFELHRNGKGNYGFLLWKTLIFAIWINKNTIIN